MLVRALYSREQHSFLKKMLHEILHAVVPLCASAIEVEAHFPLCEPPRESAIRLHYKKLFNL